MSDCLGQKISVCLLTYNHVDVIESTLRTILDQTITGYEVIVSDDCSTDGTWEQILELAAENPQIKPVRPPHNMGMPGNANFAVAQSDRPYIALLHHDDLYRADLLEKWASIMERFPDTSYVFNPYDVPDAELHYGVRLSSERIDGQNFLEQHLFKRWGCPVRGTAMIRRTVWDTVGGMKEQHNLLADVDLWMRLSRFGAVGYVPEPVIKPRHQRPDYYPDIYTQKEWSWRRHRYLYEIHASNRLDFLQLNTLFGRLKWWGFRLKLSFETTKWLIYAVVRKKPKMITTSVESVTRYDLWPLRVFRSMLQRFFPSKPILPE